MSKSRVALAILLVAVVFGVGLYLGVSVPRWIGLASTVRTYNTAALLKQVQTLSRLVTVQYIIEKVVVEEDVKWFGESRVLLVAHGVVKAGIDFSRLDSEDLRLDGNKVVVKLPPAEITDAYLDERQTKIIERTTGLLRAFDKDLEQNARQRAVDDIRRAARATGILKDADDRARDQVRNLFLQLGFEVEFVPP